MKILKTLVIFVLTMGAVGYALYSFYLYSLSPCEKPLEYSIGRFDSQFGVSKEQFLAKISDAEKPWEKVTEKELFKYVEGASFKINLIYDERQQGTVQKQKIEFGLTSAEEIFQKLDAEFNNLKSNYDLLLADYQRAVAVFEARKESYEARVAKANARGGASKGEYEALQNELASINLEAERLNRESAALSIKTDELNFLLEKRNKAAAEYNKVAENYNQKYGHGLEFNQAEYIGGARFSSGQINIYQFGSGQDLVLALTHEFGHALGMDHTENSKSIMYYSTDESAPSNIVPTAEDLAELKRVCRK